jgi:hypothetical protein
MINQISDYKVAQKLTFKNIYQSFHTSTPNTGLLNWAKVLKKFIW